MIVLGISETHCATAAVLRDGEIVGCASEERFSRLKNDAGYPRRAVEALPSAPQHILVDARTVPGIDIPQNRFDKGDGINFTIAAASIIAAAPSRLKRQFVPRHGAHGSATLRQDSNPRGQAEAWQAVRGFLEAVASA